MKRLIPILLLATISITGLAAVLHAISGRSQRAIRLYNTPTFEGPLNFGVFIWHKADAVDDAGALADGYQTNRWIDSSGNNLHSYQTNSANQAYFSNNIIGGLPAFKFKATEPDYFYLSNFLQQVTTAEAWWLLRLIEDPPIDSLNSGCWRISSSDFAVNYDHLIFTDGVIYDSQFSTNRFTTGNPSRSFTNWTIYSVASSTTTWTNFINNVPFFGTNSSHQFSVNTNAASLIFGTSKNFAGGLASRYNGYFAEILIFSNILSSAQRTNLFGYLTNKYSLGGLP